MRLYRGEREADLSLDIIEVRMVVVIASEICSEEVKN